MINIKHDKSIGYQFSIEKHRNHPAMGPKSDGGDGKMGGMNPKEISHLENQISDRLPEPIEFTYINQKKDGYNEYEGGIQWDSSSKNKAGKGTIEFQALRDNGSRMTDIKIRNMTGGMKGIDQSIFED